MKTTARIERVSKSDQPELRIVYAEVYAPDRLDSDGDFMTAETIRKMAHEFLASGKTQQVDSYHDNRLVPGCAVVESFIAREDDPIFIPGSWVVGVHVPDDEMWAKIKAQEINGFSMESLVRYAEVSVEYDVPPSLTGKTENRDNHEHEFSVSYDADGRFMGGRTNTVDGHFHLIKTGTLTEEAAGHSHKFSHLDDVSIERLGS